MKNDLLKLCFDHAVHFDGIMALVFFNNLRLKHWCFFQLENFKLNQVAIHPNSWKTLTILAIVIY